ncbi:Cyclic di-GMP phosphodiesterase PdeB [Methylophilaceae bacterium]|nr:Cyclic di-GMP phosphodiesterase PdeB [Methylophilaceae bacterium]
MSLIKQLWIATIVLVAVVFSGSLVSSIASSRNYLKEQLHEKNHDNATSLALTMSQMEKDPVNMELLLSAQFDAGHYQLIRLTDPHDNVILERTKDDNRIDAPEWFIQLVNMDIQPGSALIQDGWNQYGKLSVESDVRYAYEDLWRGSMMMMLISVIIGLASALLGSVILRKLLNPLQDIVKQAEAISQRRFISIEEPKTAEFKLVASTMNHLSKRIRGMLDEEAQRLEKLRLDANYDQISRLMSREYFFSRVDAYINNEEDFSDGVLVITHLGDLAEIDNSLGHTETNALIRRLGDALQKLTEQDSNLMAARLAGADFALFAGNETDAFALASRIKGLLQTAAGHHLAERADFRLPTICGKFSRTDSIELHYNLMTNVLDELSKDNPDILHVIGAEDVSQHQDKDELEWRDLLGDALRAGRVRLAHYPVISTAGQVIHQESPARVQLRENDFWLPAGEFISWANRLGLVSRVDMLVIEKALEELDNGSEDIGLNISTRAICDSGFIRQVANRIASKPECAKHLWLEVPERGAFEHLEEFRSFCAALKPLGCKIGIEHVGAYVSRLGELHELGLDYIKIDVSVISGIDENTGNQAFLRGLCLIAHSIGLITIAEGVQTRQELAQLPELGVDGMTGPAVR